eukprot:4031189-Pyramimonas_sp.AAC.1
MVMLLSAESSCNTPNSSRRRNVARRHITGLGMPEEVLHAVAMGLDVFGSVYTYTLSVGGYALTFPVDILTSGDAAAAGLHSHNPLTGQVAQCGHNPLTGQ